MIESFDYNLTVDWAIELLEKGIATENIYMLASFSKPAEEYEIKRYVSAVLKDLKINEEHGEYSTIAKAHYHLQLIIEGIGIRQNLIELYKLCNQCNHEYGLKTFYLLHLAWRELEVSGHNYYYDGATLKNIGGILEQQALKWIEKYRA